MKWLKLIAKILKWLVLTIVGTSTVAGDSDFAIKY
jgi:hypothetical protein